MNEKIIINNGNESKEFTKLVEYENTLTNKSYILYTDNTTENGKLKIFCNMVIQTKNGVIYEEVTDEEDIKQAKEVIDSYLEHLKTSL